MDYLDLYSPYIEFDVENQSPTHWNVKCPFPDHEDTHASAGISKATGVINCFVCGSFNPAQALHKLTRPPMALEECYGIVESFRSENNLIERDHNFSAHIPATNPRWDELYRLSQEYMYGEGVDPKIQARRNILVEDYCESKGFDERSLQKCSIGFLPAEQTHWGKDSLVFPYLYSGRVVGLRLRDIVGSKGGPPGTHFTLWGIDGLDSKPDVVVIVEGESDRIKAVQWLPEDYCVLSTPTATFRNEWVRELEGVRHKILIPQIDEPSKKMVSQAKSLVPDISVIQLPWRPKQIGKDLADWARYHTGQDLQNLISVALQRGSKRVMSTAELRVQAEVKQSWLIDNFLDRQQLGMIVGLPKSFKTWLAFGLIRAALAPGTPLWGIPELVNNGGLLKTLFIEEEGSIRGFYKRAEKVLGDLEEWETNCTWGHHMGFRSDETEWVDRISREIDVHKPNIMLVDPFSRTYSVDENSSSEMGIVFSNIGLLLTRHENLSIVLLHHFNKMGNPLDKWSALRGSGRIGAELDLGIFTERRPAKETEGPRVVIDGRDISPVTVRDSELIPLDFNDGVISLSK